MPERQFEFVDAQGKKYKWAESVLEDTILEGEDWDKPSVRKRIKKLKPGKSITIKGEKLTRVDKAKKNPDTAAAKRRAMRG